MASSVQLPNPSPRCASLLSRRMQVVTLAARQDGASFRSRTGTDGSTAAGTAGSGGPSAVPLPSGALWWQNLHTNTTPLYGTNFVLQRPTVGGPGLVKAPRVPAPVRQPAAAPAMPPVVWAAPSSGAGLGLMLAGSSLGAGAVIIDTEFTVLPGSAPAAGSGVAPNNTCVGIVWQQSVEAEEDEESAAASAAQRRRRSSRHPRRTQMLRFTCNLCGEVNDCEVNPHAWAKGSVFARCEGCTAVHKLRDNLRIFHELAGPVFPPRELRSHYLVQEILDRIQENNRN